MAGQNPERLLDAALAALFATSKWRAVLDELPTPIYTTDSEGAVTYWNRACVDFAGREPELGHDRWCVSWQLYTGTGEPLRHEDGPTAQAIRDKKPIRDAIAIAERPDGSRVAFKAYPTPLFDAEGAITGAVSMLVDVTGEQSEALREQADRCRRLAGATYDRHTSKALDDMAAGFDRTAAELMNRRR